MVVLILFILFLIFVPLYLTTEIWKEILEIEGDKYE